MSEKRILLIESGQFIGGVIHSLFTHNEQFSVLEAAPATSRELLEIVRKYNPEIIVMDDTVCRVYLPILFRHMQNSPGMRVVVVNTDSNRIELYDKQQINLHQTADFFAVL